tara:strand:+ start:113 stop:505 length:393 start_codon:yes stop_codon:yes gene_type:complete
MSDDSGTVKASGTSANIPTGSGTERLRRITVHALNNGWQNNVLAGTAGHLYTILSVIFCNNTGTTTGIAMRVNDGSNDILLTSDGSQKVAAYQTYVWNDKFVIEEDDILEVYNGHTNGDWWISYIDQDWS